jgi:hypothetical protein
VLSLAGGWRCSSGGIHRRIFRRTRDSPAAETKGSMKVGKGYSGRKPGSSHEERVQYPMRLIWMVGVVEGGDVVEWKKTDAEQFVVLLVVISGLTRPLMENR